MDLIKYDRGTGPVLVWISRQSLDDCGPDEMDRSRPNMAKTFQRSNRSEVCEKGLIGRKGRPVTEAIEVTADLRKRIGRGIMRDTAALLIA